jgi:hypothetical protein
VSGGTPPPRRAPRLALVAAGAASLALFLYRYRTVPDGLVNDSAEEALRGLLLVEGRRLEVLTFVLGNSAETLWLYVLGLSAKLLGPSVLAVALPSALAAAGVVVLVALAVESIDPDVPLFLPVLLAAGSPWLLHYARSGYRAIAAPLFLAGTAYLLARAARTPERLAGFAAAGAAAGLSVYAYTACRVLPVALALTFAALAARDRAWLRRAGAAAAGLAAVSIPNVAFLLRHPREFLGRGGYVFVGSLADRAANVGAVLLLPFHYLDRYRLAAGPGGSFDADGTSATLTAGSLEPVPLVAGLLFALGLVLALRSRRDPATIFLALTVASAVVFFGPAGPSLTRLLLVVPALAIFGSFGAAALARTAPARAGAAAVLVAVAVYAQVSYFRALGSGRREIAPFASPAATAMGERAREAAARGPVLCVVTGSANVVRFLAHGTQTRVLEFWDRPFDPREAESAGPAVTVLVERSPRFRGWTPAGFAEGDRPDERYAEFVRGPSPP